MGVLDRIGDMIGQVFGGQQRATGAIPTQPTSRPQPHPRPQPSPGGIGGAIGGPSGIGGMPLPQPAPAPLPDPQAPQILDRRGEESWRFELNMAGHRPGTPQFDKWVLSLPLRDNDPEFNNIVRAHQIKAQVRERQREQAQKSADDSRARIGGQTFDVAERFREASDVVRNAIEELRGGRVMLGPDGEPLPEQFTIRADGSIQGLQAQLTPEDEQFLASIEDPIERAQAREAIVGGIGGVGFLEAGMYLWMGEMTLDENGREVDSYMSAENAINLPYYWSMDQVMYAQEAFGMDPTGFVDQTFVNAWHSLVGTSAGYTAAGRNVSPFVLLDMMHNAEEARRAGSGGGGSGAGRAYDISETTGLLNRVMSDEAGREASTEEARAFHGALNAAGMDLDPQQFAIDWVRSQVGEEAGAFQVATDFYQAMMQVLGTAGSEATNRGPQ